MSRSGTAWEDAVSTEGGGVMGRVGGCVGIDERSTHEEEPVEEGLEVMVLVNLRPQ